MDNQATGGSTEIHQHAQLSEITWWAWILDCEQTCVYNLSVFVKSPTGIHF